MLTGHGNFSNHLLPSRLRQLVQSEPGKQHLPRYYIIPQIWPEIKIIPGEELTLFLLWMSFAVLGIFSVPGFVSS